MGFFAEARSGTPGEILQRVLEQHYATADAPEIPTQILVQHKGRKVTLITSVRQSKAELKW